MWPPEDNADGTAVNYYINGPGRLTSALQIRSRSSTPAHHDDSLDADDRFSRSSSSPPAADRPELLTKTVVASDNDVSNGFVKNGKKLPYVFEANDAGIRKRSSKILPVCGVCGKKFVCVTTMKRHLVTHTGEKPFSCKVCGKQYTQKGNLRVHERTHRNDRPFECNICHQKFYRKEPMQKHQWRQHGVIHYKTRPNPTSNNQSSVGIIGAEGVLYNTLADRVKIEQPEHFDDSPTPPRFVPPPPAPPTVVAPPPPVEPTPPAKTEDKDEQHSVPKFSYVNHHMEEFSHAKLITAPAPEPTPASAPYPVPPPPSTVGILPLRDSAPNSHLLKIDPLPQPDVADEKILLDLDRPAHPLKLKMKLAQLYQQEIEEKEQKKAVVSLQSNLSGMNLHPSSSDGSPPGSEESEAEDLRPDPRNQRPRSSEESEAEEKKVECHCKTCGNTFSVVDPYNFKCGNCHVKYSSLPTHMIADPLQCIGCCQVFPHKPALKAHQVSAADKERPFVCCKCCYGFRQKAHLQKHQWRIHRRKLEPDPNVKEAEVLLTAIDNPEQSPALPVVRRLVDSNISTMTLQDIIDHGVEASMDDGRRVRNDSGEGPLDLSPAKTQKDRPHLTLQDLVKTKFTPLPPRRTLMDPSRIASNPLINRSPTSFASEEPSSSSYPAWKKQKTTGSHASLPPILTKPYSAKDVRAAPGQSGRPELLRTSPEVLRTTAPPTAWLAHAHGHDDKSEYKRLLQRRLDIQEQRTI